MIFLLQAAEPRWLIGLPRSGEQTSSVENNKSGEWPPPLGSCTRYEVKRRNVFLLLWSHPMLCASPWTLTGSQSPSVPLTGSDCASRRGGAQREQTAGGGLAQREAVRITPQQHAPNRAGHPHHGGNARFLRTAEPPRPPPPQSLSLHSSTFNRIQFASFKNYCHSARCPRTAPRKTHGNGARHPIITCSSSRRAVGLAVRFRGIFNRFNKFI